MRQLFKIFSVVLLVIMLACDNDKSKHDNQVVDNKLLEELLVKNNVDLLKKESDLIDDYVKRNGLEVTKTGTGVRFQILNAGEGELIKKGDIITIQYEVSFLNGEVVYSSENDGNKTFVVGRGGVESGLEEGVLKLNKYSEAILILPSHLAHGLVGDGRKILHKSVLVYRLKVTDIK